MSTLIFQDITVSLSTQGDSFLSDIAHLILKVSLNGQSVDEINLFSRESNPGIWDADQRLVLREISEGFMLSVSMDLGGEDHQLLAFMELNGSRFYNELGKIHEVPLLCHENYPSLVLKTRVSSEGSNEDSTSGVNQRIVPSNMAATIKQIHQDAFAAYSEFNSHGNLQSLDNAIMHYQRAVDMLRKDDPQLPELLNSLGSCLARRFEVRGDVVDINSSIDKFRMAVSTSLTGDPDKATRLKNLGNSLDIRLKKFGNLADLRDVIAAKQEAVNLTTNSNADKPVCLSNLATSLETRFERLGNIADIDNAIAARQAAVNLLPNGHRHKAACLSNLGVSYKTRFQRLGNLVDIDNAIISQQAAVHLTPNGHPGKADRLSNLGNSYITRFGRLGAPSDVNKAIDSIRMAVNIAPANHPHKLGYLSNLGNALEARFKRLGNIADVDDAIKLAQAAIDLTPDGHPHKHACINNLGNSFYSRFQRLGSLADLDNAVKAKQAVITITPNGHPKRADYLSNLGVCLETRFQKLGNRVDIDAAITSGQQAVVITPDRHPQKCLYLNNLGISFETRFQKFGDVTDLEEAMKSTQAAVDLAPENHPRKAGYYTNLGNSLATRFQQLRNHIDIDNAIKAHQAAVDLTPDGHPDKIRCLVNLGRSFWTRYDHLHSPRDTEAAIFNLSAAANSQIGPPMHRFKAAEAWGSIASLTNHPSVLSAYECVINILPLVAWLGLPITGRHQHLVEIGGITRDAGAAAISLDKYDKALEWLEQGRSIVWTQILQLRTPIDDLRAVKPELAEHLVQISRLLDQGAEQEGFSDGEQQSAEEKGRQYRILTMERESIINQIRSLPNFESFLRPLNSDQLMKVPRDGPVVVLNIARRRCDALALIPGLDEVIHIPLLDTTSKKIIVLANELKDLLHSSGIRLRGERAARRVENETDSERCNWTLSELWKGVVKPVLDSLALSPNPDVLPRIWWCATGPLAFLPIHAAGIYESESEDDELGNYAISSYTPTLSALFPPSNRVIEPAFKLLSVIQPSAPGVSSIPNTREELACLRRRLVNQDLVVLEGPEGTKTQVVNGMKDCNWLHLACHGVQKPEDPTKSALILEDGHLTLEEIIRLNLPSAELAFLSACQTTAGDEKLSEEAVHIAGGMLLAGYRGVVATMWSIQDDLAPEVADEFYAHIVKDDERPDSRKAAEALHISIRKLRERRNIPLTAWIPFVHLGV